MGKKDKRSFIIENVDNDQQIKTPVSKDKKKKKHHITESNGVLLENQNDSYLQENQTNHSPKKRKTQKLTEVPQEENYKQHDDLEMLESSEWSKDENMQLLDVVKNLSKRYKKPSYRVALNKLDFEKVASEMEGDKTSDECKSQVKLLITKVNKIKPLHQVISEAITFAKENVVIRKSAVHLFWEDNQEWIRSVAQQDEKPNVLKTRSELWKELPQEKKSFYEGKVEQLKKTVKPKEVKEGEFESPVISPFRIFLESHQEKYPSLTFTEARQKYSKRDIQKKIKFIKKSFQTLYLEKEALKKYSELYPDKPPPSPKKIGLNYPNQEEVKFYYHNHLGLPNIPPKSLAIFAMNENNLDSNNLITASTEFTKLDKIVQEQWKIKFKKAWTDYLEHLNEWIPTQNPANIELMDKWPYLKRETMPSDVNRKVRENKNLLPEERKEMSIKKEFLEVVMPINIKKFENEPPLPALTVLAVYEAFLQKEGQQYEKTGLMRKFLSLSDTERAHIQEKATHVRNKYIKHLKKYVNGLTEEMRKLYLGLRRKKLMNALKEDIFEEIYPDKDYPVYVKQLTSSKIGEREQKNKTSFPTKKGKRNLLPLENEMLDINPLKENSSKSKKGDTGISRASDSKEQITDSSFESSPREVKKRKMSPPSPQKSKRNKTPRSSSSDSEEISNDSDVESSPNVKMGMLYNTDSTKSPKKLISAEESSSDSENEEESKLSPKKSLKLENSSSEEEEDISEAWQSKHSFY